MKNIDMDIHEFAKKLDGRQRDYEIYAIEKKLAEKLGFVVVFGYSDDIAFFEGAINDEAPCIDRTEIRLNANGLVDECECECKHYIKALGNTKSIYAYYGQHWSFSTKIKHAKFEIYKEKDLYCVGIVFEKRCLQ